MRLMLALVALGLAPAAAGASDLWGIRYDRGSQGSLARLDPLSLRALGPGVKVPGYASGWDRFGDRVAVGASSRGRVLLANLRSRRSRVLRLGERLTPHHIVWDRNDRLVVVGGFDRIEQRVLDPRSGRIVSRASLGGREVAVARTKDRLVLLLGPTKGVGPARLVVLRPDGSMRSIALRGVRAGSEDRPNLRPDDEPDLRPGLAVRRGVAYVLRADRDAVVVVDLESGASKEHALGVPARASKGGATRFRALKVLSDGRLAAAGHALEYNGSNRPWGLRVIDPLSWTARLVAPRVTFVQTAGDVLLYTRYERRRRARPTVFAYSPSGRRLWSLAPRFGISNVLVAGQYVYVQNGARRGRNHRTHVVSARSGRQLRVLRFKHLPFLLARP